MIRLTAFLISLFFASSVYATPITYQIVEPAQPTLTGSFTLDHTLANPFVAWQFEYVYPEASRILGWDADGTATIVERFPSPILGQTWDTDDGGLWGSRGHMLTVTNEDQMILSFQLCHLICSDTPNTWVMSVFDPHYILYDTPGVLYSGGGLFAAVSAPPVLTPGDTQSVPEPGAFWLLVGGLGVVVLMRRIGWVRQGL